MNLLKNDSTSFIIITILTIIMVISILYIIVQIHNDTVYNTCKDYEKQTGLHTKFSDTSGCYVKINGRWHHINELQPSKPKPTCTSFGGCL